MKESYSRHVFIRRPLLFHEINLDHAWSESPLRPVYSRSELKPLSLSYESATPQINSWVIVCACRNLTCRNVESFDWSPKSFQESPRTTYLFPPHLLLQSFWRMASGLKHLGQCMHARKKSKHVRTHTLKRVWTWVIRLQVKSLFQMIGHKT